MMERHDISSKESQESGESILSIDAEERRMEKETISGTQRNLYYWCTHGPLLWRNRGRPDLSLAELRESCMSAAWDHGVTVLDYLNVGGQASLNWAARRGESTFTGQGRPERISEVSSRRRGQPTKTFPFGGYAAEKESKRASARLGPSRHPSKGGTSTVVEPSARDWAAENSRKAIARVPEKSGAC